MIPLPRADEPKMWALTLVEQDGSLRYMGTRYLGPVVEDMGTGHRYSVIGVDKQARKAVAKRQL
jgi:hypothetical protein